MNIDTSLVYILLIIVDSVFSVNLFPSELAYFLGTLTILSVRGVRKDLCLTVLNNAQEQGRFPEAHKQDLIQKT